jgi:sortase A
VVFWRDRVTRIYTAYVQNAMGSQLSRTCASWKDTAQREHGVGDVPGTHGGASASASARKAQTLRSAHRLAARFAASEAGRTGRPIGRIRISRIGLSTITVEGTDYWGSLSKGPGRYKEGSFPGLGKTTGIAGHRTTFAAPFRHIDSIRTGDPIVVQMPYGTFTYTVLRHKIVDNGDWSIMKKVGFDELVLSACHPLYSAEQRYVVFARLTSIKLPGARSAVAVLPARSSSAV